MYLDFSDEGLFIDLVGNCRFEDLLEGNKWSGEFMLSHINWAKCSFSTKVENVEIINGQILGDIFLTLLLI